MTFNYRTEIFYFPLQNLDMNLQIFTRKLPTFAYGKNRWNRNQEKYFNQFCNQDVWLF